MTVTAYLGLGTNLGDRYQQLHDAMVRLHQSEGIQITAISSIYETIPVGFEAQPLFYNLACQIDTVLSPAQLLETVQQIEHQLQRVRTIRWGPRTIDIDILLYGSHIIQQTQLIIPHPRLVERGFVLVPLSEIRSDLVIPDTKKTVDEWLRELPAQQGIRKMEQQIDMNSLTGEKHADF